jgi:transcription-repair coupling factor (superfamily II helicase)
MMEFVEGSADVLLATNIVESGVATPAPLRLNLHQG